jgi:ketosteroid isomerase-like protein
MADTLAQVAAKLVAHCKAGTEREGLRALYRPDAVSVEAFPGPDGTRESRGLNAINGKHDWWEANFTVHGGNVEGPFLHGDDRFAVIFDVDAEEKATGQRMPVREVGLYTVAGGKIVREEFFNLPRRQ